MSSLRLDDLHPLYRKVSHEEAITIANLGARCYQSTKDSLYESWQTSQSEDETVRTAIYRKEGADAMMEALQARLATGEAAKARVAALQSEIEFIVEERISAVLERERLVIQIQKVAPLQQRISVLESKDETISLLKEGNASIKDKYASLEEKYVALQEEIKSLREAKTLSSHTIGKQGEATIWEMLEDTVLPEFPYAEAFNMVGKDHVADFHLTMMTSSGRKVKFLIDSKKYKRAVSSDEITKLASDVDADDGAHAGILVSLTSTICKMRQFQLGLTPKEKPLLFLTFAGMTPELQRDTLCWGVRVLLGFVGNNVNNLVKEEVLKKIDTFVANVEGSVKELDANIRLQLKLVDSLRDTRRGLLENIVKFKGDEETIEHEEGCAALVKLTGARCGKRVVDGDRCGNHRLRKYEGGEIYMGK
jgi:hypothetical protein